MSVGSVPILTHRFSLDTSIMAWVLVCTQGGIVLGGEGARDCATDARFRGIPSVTLRMSDLLPLRSALFFATHTFAASGQPGSGWRDGVHGVHATAPEGSMPTSWSDRRGDLRAKVKMEHSLSLWGQSSERIARVFQQPSFERTLRGTVTHGSLLSTNGVRDRDPGDVQSNLPAFVNSRLRPCAATWVGIASPSARI
jgi:hypothetical protein